MAKKSTSSTAKSTVAKPTRTTTKAKAPAKKPAAKKPAAKPAATKVTAKKPAAKPAAKKPAAKPAVKKPVVAKKPAAKPVAAKPAAKKPATKKPAAKKPAEKKPKTKTVTSGTPVKTPAPAARKPRSSSVQLKDSVTTITAPRTGPTKAAARPVRNALDLRELNFTPYDIRHGEDYMNTQQQAHFKSILQGWKQALMEQVDQTVNHLQDEPGNLADPSDRATQEEEFNLELRTRDRERKLISKIDVALNQIKQSDYGFCSQCGEEIGIRRLEARPTATLCIDCKTLSEIREKHFSS